jgi:hypothetical protein
MGLTKMFDKDLRKLERSTKFRKARAAILDKLTPEFIAAHGGKRKARAFASKELTRLAYLTVTDDSKG